MKLGQALRLIWESTPGWTAAGGLLMVVQGLLPLAALYLIRKIVDLVAAGIAGPARAQAFEQVFPWILLAGGVALLAVLARSLAELTGEAQTQIVTDAVSDAIHSQSIAVDLEYYEEPRYHDSLHRAQSEALFRPQRILGELTQIGQNGLSLVGIAGLLLSFNWKIGLLLFAVALPAAVVRLIYARRLYALTRGQTEKERRAWYYHWMLTDPGHAKEVRLFGLGRLFQRRFLDIRENLRGIRISLAGRRSLADFLAQAVATLCLFGSFAWIVRATLRAELSVGSMVMYYQGFQSGLGFLQGLLRGLAGLYEDRLFLSSFGQFLELKPGIEAPSSPVEVPPVAGEGIRFHGVSFTYPRSERPALEEVNLSIGPDQVIALVGENGSGKTTLVKLLCRLYDPTAGEVTVEGTGLRRLDPERWRREIGVVFQDYVHYHLTARENVWLGNIELPPSDPELVRAARMSGAEAMIRRLPRGWETILGRQFEEGQELSAGEWQKMALARAFLRDARIIVCDEPSSALDPHAEAEVFEGFRRLMRGRSAVLISHRYSTVHMCDAIYVLDKGRIVEHGSHRELLDRGGVYAGLYRAQADRYQQEPPRATVRPG